MDIPGRSANCRSGLSREKKVGGRSRKTAPLDSSPHAIDREKRGNKKSDGLQESGLRINHINPFTMASSLAAQLSQIAAKSTNELDLKSQRISHSHSLIFERKIAGSQDFDTIYDICYEGFRELCSLDSRFEQFARTIFSEQSKSEDRTQMNAAQNKELDTVIDTFLALVGGRLQLSPAVKAVDWLVRRFRFVRIIPFTGCVESALAKPSCIDQFTELTNTTPLLCFSPSSHITLPHSS